MKKSDAMIKMLITSQDTNSEIHIGITYRDDVVACGVHIVPDVMIVGNWVEITDKMGLSDFYVSFDISDEVEYDEEMAEYTLCIGDIKIIIS